VVLEGDPHRPAAVAVAKGRSASDEVEIVAVKGEVYIAFCSFSFL
jgi:hypothetical protein